MGRLTEAIYGKTSGSSRIGQGGSSRIGQGGRGFYKDLEVDLNIWIDKVQKTVGVAKSKKHLRKGAAVIQREMKKIIKSETGSGRGQRKLVYRYKKTGNKEGDSDRVSSRRHKQKNRRQTTKPGSRGGDVLAIYSKNNLMRSIKVFTFKKSNAVFAGATYAGGKARRAKMYKGRTADGYYAHMINNGTSNTRGIFFKERASKSKMNAAKHEAIESAMIELGAVARKKGIA